MLSVSMLAPESLLSSSQVAHLFPFFPLIPRDLESEVHLSANSQT